MFDANAAYINIGEKFFAEVHELDSQLKAFGIKKGDIVVCEHVKKSEFSERDNLESLIWTSMDSDPFVWKSKPLPRRGVVFDAMPSDIPEDWRESSMVYSGVLDGDGFISMDWEAKALEFLGGKWLDTPDAQLKTNIQQEKQK